MRQPIDPVTTFRFRAFPSFLRAATVIMVSWFPLAALILLVPTLARVNFELLPQFMAPSMFLFLGLAITLLYLSGPRRVLQTGYGMLVLSSRSEELARVPLTDLVRARVYSRYRRPLIELTDRYGRVLEIHGYPPLLLADRIADHLKGMLPHVESSKPAKLLPWGNNQRIIDFIPH